MRLVTINDLNPNLSLYVLALGNQVTTVFIDHLSFLDNQRLVPKNVFLMRMNRNLHWVKTVSGTTLY